MTFIISSISLSVSNSVYLSSIGSSSLRSSNLKKFLSLRARVFFSSPNFFFSLLVIFLSSYIIFHSSNRETLISYRIFFKSVVETVPVSSSSSSLKHFSLIKSFTSCIPSTLRINIAW